MAKEYWLKVSFDSCYPPFCDGLSEEVQKLLEARGYKIKLIGIGLYEPEQETRYEQHYKTQ